MDKQSTIEESELLKLKNELTRLQNQLADLTNQKSSKEKLIQDFNNKFYSQVGDLLKEVTVLRLEKLRVEAQEGVDNAEEVKHTKRDYDEFNRQFEETRSKKVATLPKEEQALLAKMYKGAFKLCHPDIVAEEFAAEAAQIASELNIAYELNDLARVREIHDSLQKNRFPRKSDKFTDKDRIVMAIESLKMKIKKVKAEIAKIDGSEIYQQISHITDWDTYIDHIKKQLEIEALALKKYLSKSQ